MGFDLLGVPARPGIDGRNACSRHSAYSSSTCLAAHPSRTSTWHVLGTCYTEVLLAISSSDALDQSHLQLYPYSWNDLILDWAVLFDCHGESEPWSGN